MLCSHGGDGHLGLNGFSEIIQILVLGFRHLLMIYQERLHLGLTLAVIALKILTRSGFCDR